MSRTAIIVILLTNIGLAGCIQRDSPGNLPGAPPVAPIEEFSPERGDEGGGY